MGVQMRALSRKEVVVWAVVLVVAFTSVVFSHCQIPCGIYDDETRLAMLAEHIATVEKAMKQIEELSRHDKPNMNQIVRWVQNKDKHADELSQIVTYYFMAQRLKPVAKADSKEYKEYVGKLTLLHEMLFYSMKAKQTTELENAEKLRAVLKDFRAVYLGRAEAEGQGT